MTALRRHYVQPTLVTGAHAGMRIAQEEVFGPFLTVIPFRDEKNASKSPTTYNTASPAMSGPRHGRALRVATNSSRMIWLNSENVRHLPTPFAA